jgi:hypothetical protein
MPAKVAMAGRYKQLVNCNHANSLIAATNAFRTMAIVFTKKAFPAAFANRDAL